MVANDDNLEIPDWKKRGVYHESRYLELVTMYEEAGFEVRVEPFCSEAEDGCVACMEADPDQYRTVYTKKPNK